MTISPPIKPQVPEEERSDVWKEQSKKMNGVKKDERRAQKDE